MIGVPDLRLKRLGLYLLLMISIPCWGGGSSPKCFVALAKLDKKLIKLIPDQIQIPKDNSELKELVHIGTLEFVDNFYSEFVTDRISFMTSEDSADLSKRDIRALIEARKIGQIPRSLYRLLSFEGEVPSNFDEFMRRFGKALDRTRKSEFDKVAPHATKALKFIKAGALEHSLTNPIQTRLKSFRRNLKGMVFRILELSESSRITKREYHELRKRVRDLKILFYLVAEMVGSEESLNVYAIFNHIDDRLGDTKDDLKEIEEEYGNRIEGELITRVSSRDREVLLPLMYRVLEAMD